jgi:hypothetical protein
MEALEQDAPMEEAMEQDAPMGPTEAEPMEAEPPEVRAESTDIPSNPPARIRKVRITTPAPTPAAEPPHVFWASRLQEHREARRAEKNERYSNLRLY